MMTVGMSFVFKEIFQIKIQNYYSTFLSNIEMKMTGNNFHSSTKHSHLSPFFVYVLILGVIGIFVLYRNIDIAISNNATQVPKSSFRHEESLSTLTDRQNINIVFSTDCSVYQNWQSILLFYSANLVDQPGSIIRIAFGCSEQQKQPLVQALQTLFPHEKYYIHFAPDFSVDHQNRTYLYYNKSWGLKHLLDHGKFNFVKDNNSVIAVIDPDFIFLRQLLIQTSEEDEISAPNTKIDHRLPYLKAHHAIAQFYEIGGDWTIESNGFHRKEVCGNSSRCNTITREEAEKLFSVGSPYIMRLSDWKVIAHTWTSFATRLFDFQPIHMSEMYAYSMATVHHSIQHIVLHDLMVSNVKVESEGWHLIDKIDQMCLPPSKIRNDNGGQQTSLFYTEQRLPTFVHYCQIYALDSNIKWSKYEMKSNDNFQCNHEKEVGIKLQSLRIVDDLQSKTKTKFVDQEENFYNGSIKSLKLRNNSSTVFPSSFLPSGDISSSTVIRRNAFIICIIQDLLTRAMQYYQKIACTT